MAITGSSCVACGGARAGERVAPVTHKVGQRSVVVKEDRHLYCPDCETVSYRGALLAENQEAIARQVRLDEGLLTPDELRVIRLKYGLTQADMEALLQIGPKTWVRWERGRVVQSQTADQLIRLIARKPDVLRDLMTLRNVSSPVATAALADFDQALEERVERRLHGLLGGVSDATVKIAARAVSAEFRTDQPSKF